MQFVNLLVLKSIRKEKKYSELQRVRQWAGVSYTNFLTAQKSTAQTLYTFHHSQSLNKDITTSL